MAVAAAFVVIAAAIYFVFDPSTSLFPRCPFFVVTGLKCPGCGTQRAVHSLLHGNVVDALRFNAILAVAIPFLALMGVALAVRRRYPKLHRRLNGSLSIWCWLVLVVGWWIGRNIAGL